MENLPHLVGRLEGQVNDIICRFEAADESRGRLRDDMAKLAGTLGQIDLKITTHSMSVSHELMKIGERLNVIEPAVAEYTRVRQNVRAAGWLGKTLWLVGTALLAFAAGAFGLFTQIASFFRGT